MKLSARAGRKSTRTATRGRSSRTSPSAFGADRLMYGGGFGAKATGESYRAERERVAALWPTCPTADRAKVLGGTAARLFGFAVGRGPLSCSSPPLRGRRIWVRGLTLVGSEAASDPLSVCPLAA